MPNKNKRNLKLDWNKTNELTKIAYKKSRKRKWWIISSLIIFISSLTTIFTAFSAYSFKKFFDYNSFNKNPIHIVIPPISEADIIKNFQIFDSDSSTLYYNFNKLVNAKIDNILKNNTWIKLYFKFIGISEQNITIKLFEDEKLQQPWTIQDLLYDGEKPYYIQVENNNKPIKMHLSVFKVTINWESLYYSLFVNFKNLFPITTSDSDGDNSAVSAAYIPNRFFDKTASDLYHEVSIQLQNYLLNESQETTPSRKKNKPNLTNSKTNNNIMELAPIITNEPLTPIYDYNSLPILQNQFKKIGNDYVTYYNLNNNNFNISDGTKFYITYFPQSFNVDAFVNDPNPISYYQNLENHMLPIYQINLPYLKLVKLLQSIFTTNPDLATIPNDSIEKQQSFISNDFEIGNFLNYFKYSFRMYYQKQNITLTEDETMDEFKSTVSQYLYNSLLSSVTKSYPEFKFIIPTINNSKQILQIFFNIKKPSDLENDISFSDIFHINNSIEKITDLPKELQKVGFEAIKQVNFNLKFNVPIDYRSYFIITSPASFSWNINGSINFYYYFERE